MGQKFEARTYGEHCLFPNKETVCGLPPPLSLTKISPPPVKRDQVTERVHDCLAPRFFGHAFPRPKGPVIVTLVMLSAALPTLVSVVVFDGVQSQ